MALAGVINLLDPEVIVLGGGLSALPGLYDEVPRLWRPLVVAPDPQNPPGPGPLRRRERPARRRLARL